MTDYTPTTEQVRDGFRYDPVAEYHDPITPHHIYGGRAFDRWLDRYTRQKQAEELRELARVVNLHSDVPNRDDLAYLCDDDDCLWWDMTRSLQQRLLERADRIESADV